MKQITLYVLAATMLIVDVLAQGHAPLIPLKVKEEFKRKFPRAEKASWDKEKNTFEVNFILEAKKYSVNFDRDGHLTETEMEIAISDVPQKIQERMKQEYPDSKITAVAKITDLHNQVTYELEIKRQKKTVELFFSALGERIKK